MAEAAAVTPEGRISRDDLGIWDDAHVEPLRRITRFIDAQGAVAAIQLAHAGRKASTAAPFRGGRPVSPDAGGWTPRGPSALPFADGYATPVAMTATDITT
jgi:2,4-dienoyl-CoA reductase-like NADH-dependent reductase (Old Yellow Enzyme family)